jgi:hypothetical protein
VNCPRCQRSNGELRRFCGGCGASLELACGACAFVNDAVDRFCGGCGETMPGEAAPAAATGGEVAMLTVAEVQALLAELPGARAASAAQLPQAAIDQDDLDRLFGGAP